MNVLVMIIAKKDINFINFIYFQETDLFFVRITALNFMAKMEKVKNMKLFIHTYLIIKKLYQLEILMK